MMQLQSRLTSLYFTCYLRTTPEPYIKPTCSPKTLPQNLRPATRHPFLRLLARYRSLTTLNRQVSANMTAPEVA
jgi:hypothetical protein